MLKDHIYKYSALLNSSMCTLALSDQPKDWTVTSKRFISSFLRTSYSLAMAWLIASIFSWNKIKTKQYLILLDSCFKKAQTICFIHNWIPSTEHNISCYLNDRQNNVSKHNKEHIKYKFPFSALIINSLCEAQPNKVLGLKATTYLAIRNMHHIEPEFILISCVKYLQIMR